MCPECPNEGVLAAQTPYFLPKAMCGDGLLVRLLVAKFGDHLPLNRQAAQLAREGFEVDTNVLAGWVQQAANRIEPLVNEVIRQLLTGEHLQADDTRLPVQDGADGKLRNGRLWAFTDQEQVFFVFSDTKKGAVPAEILAGYKGELLLVDGGSEFNQAVETLGLTRAGCWSHARRYFVDAIEQHPRDARLALDTIRDLFLIERELAAATDDERRAVRDARSRLLVDGLYAWISKKREHVRPMSALGHALTYLVNQESELRAFLDHPRLPLHNNLTELMLRGPVVGRKNWLFAGSEGGATAACKWFTLISSCRLQGVDPHRYLEDVLPKLWDWPAKDLWQLTPKAWAEAHPR
jgi:transposase